MKQCDKERRGHPAESHASRTPRQQRARGMTDPHRCFAPVGMNRGPPGPIEVLHTRAPHREKARTDVRIAAVPPYSDVSLTHGRAAAGHSCKLLLDFLDGRRRCPAWRAGGGGKPSIDLLPVRAWGH